MRGSPDISDDAIDAATESDDAIDAATVANQASDHERVEEEKE